ncbi:MAG: bifunctional alpha,alpha-trehalose-phosphate synthase (UDP-forming)/trehalose-phosphatase, partial [Chloroflexota bacterium]|nr:bifunctional alpha,alpha-trehalose-phosphate synthase (UDP-forming)/trehalose-phosphatase [Chloroflexota bacterium]
FNAYPVFVDEEAMEKFYHGFCNKTVWPLFHYLPSYAEFREEYWEEYKAVNQTFADAVLEIARPGDTIWVHDYQLMLLPGLIRDRIPDVTVGFFLHIPFPGYEIFRVLPRKWATEILHGMLGADLVGFHTHEYTQYFTRTVLRELGYEQNLGEVLVNDRLVKVETFPMGIDFNRYHEAVTTPEVERERRLLYRSIVDTKLVLSIDRLDYTKGIINRLQGFARFLEENPDWHGRVMLALVIVPSRIGVERYQETKERIEEIVGRTNGRFGSITWTPITYQFKAIPFPLLVAMYNVSDVALITPLRDGMNLIAKEYVAARNHNGGVLILSEFAGAAKELGDAIIINPHSREEIAEAIKEALEMPLEEQDRRMQRMQDLLRRYDIMYWAEDFMGQLSATRESQEKFRARLMSDTVRDRLLDDYRHASKRLLLLDYDGTLVPFNKDPQQARPGDDVMQLLAGLCETPGNRVVLISGRDKETLDRWFGHLPMGLVAEHGVWARQPHAGTWTISQPLTSEWKSRIRPVLEMYANRLPGSFLEEKDFSIAWHYRGADPDLGPSRAKELLDHLVNFTANINVQVLQGNKVIEVKTAGVSKGTAGRAWLDSDDFDFVLAIGDDWTDEHLFMVLPESAYSVRVGMVQSYARYNLRAYTEVTRLLEELSRTTPSSMHGQEAAQSAHA